MSEEYKQQSQGGGYNQQKPGYERPLNSRLVPTPAMTSHSGGHRKSLRSVVPIIPVVRG